MGFFKGVGKVAGGLMKGVGNVTIGGGIATGVGLGETVGKTITNAFSANAAGFIGAVGIGAAAGAISADLAKEDTGKGVKAGVIGAAGIASATGVMNGTIGKIAGDATAKAIGSAGSGLVASVGAGVLGVAGTGVATAAGIGGAMLKMPTNKAVGIGTLSDIKLRKSVALPVMAAAGLIGGALSAEKKFTQSRMGTHDGLMRTATPVVPQQQQSGGYDNGGATGDLVFAMRNNR